MTPQLFDPVWQTEIDGYPRALTASPDGRSLAAGTDDGHVHVLRTESGAVEAQHAIHSAAVTDLRWNPRLPLLASAGEDGAVFVHNVGEGSSQEASPKAHAWAQHVAWNPKGSKLASAIGRAIKIWALDGRGNQVLPELESTVAGLAWSPDGEQVAGACYGGVRVFDPKTGRRMRKLDWKGSMINLVWSPNGKVIACGCQDNSVHFWRLSTGRDSMMSGYALKPSAIAWSHDSAMLATGGGLEVTVWPFDGKGPEGAAPVVLQGHTTPILKMAFSPLVKVLATADRTGEILIWFPDESPAAVRRHKLPGRIEDLQWVLDPERGGLLLAACDSQGHVAAWPLRA